MNITPTEFARRLCSAEHAKYATTGNPTPCGVHTALSQRYWGLLADRGRTLLDVIDRIRAEEGLPGPTQEEVALRD